MCSLFGFLHFQEETNGFLVEFNFETFDVYLKISFMELSLKFHILLLTGNRYLVFFHIRIFLFLRKLGSKNVTK